LILQLRFGVYSKVLGGNTENYNDHLWVVIVQAASIMNSMREWVKLVTTPLETLISASAEALARIEPEKGMGIALIASSVSVCLTIQRVNRFRGERERAQGDNSLSNLQSPLAALAAEGRSTLSYANDAATMSAPGSPNPVSRSSSSESTGSTNSSKSRNFFKFRPPRQRTAPPPEVDAQNPAVPAVLVGKGSSSSSSSSSKEAAESEAGDDSAADEKEKSSSPTPLLSKQQLSSNITTRPTPRRFQSASSPLLDAFELEADSVSDTESNGSDSTVFSLSRGGVRFVDNSDSESEGSEVDSTASGARRRGTVPTIIGSGVGKVVPRMRLWKPQFTLSVPKWEYSPQGEVVFTVRSSYTPSSSWTVRRTYAQFSAWYASLGGAEGELKGIQARWPAAEFVLFYLPVDAIEKRISQLHAFMSEVSNTEAVMTREVVFRSLLQFLDPDPQDEEARAGEADDVHRSAGGHDLQM
jgi:hypothetical protein